MTTEVRFVPGTSRSRRVESVMLAMTIPAFYLSVLSIHRGASAALYLVALAATAWVIWKEAGGVLGRRGPSRRSSDQLGLLLALALLLSGLLPQGAGADLLVVRFGTAALILLRFAETALPPAWQGGLPRLLGLGIGVLGLCGLGFWWLEPSVQTFGDGLWLAFTTAATVGYGDIVPSTPAAKFFAVFVVLMGLAVLSLVTASIAALWVQAEERRIEHEVLRDLHRELKTIREELVEMRSEVAAARATGGRS